MKTYKELDVYKRSYELAVSVHGFVSQLPKEFKYDLIDQIRRATRSIPANIAEGFGRGKSRKDTVNQLRTALGSNDEVLFNFEFMRDVKLINTESSKHYIGEYTIIGKQLVRLIQSIDKPVTSNQ